VETTAISLDEDFSVGVFILFFFGCTLGKKGIGKRVDKTLGNVISSTANIKLDHYMVGHDDEDDDEWDSSTVDELASFKVQTLV
jgi:hypothetical protein